MDDRAVTSEQLRDGLEKFFGYDDYKRWDGSRIGCYSVARLWNTQFFSELQQTATEEVAKCQNDVFISMPTGTVKDLHSFLGCVYLRDVFVVGAGKSLCYMLPGAVGKGVTVVVSPLLALMQDQLNVLRNAGISATTINSLVSEEERLIIEKMLKQVPQPAYKFLYLTPEQCATVRTRGLLSEMAKKRFIRCIAVDEAHCISGKEILAVAWKKRMGLDPV